MDNKDLNNINNSNIGEKDLSNNDKDKTLETNKQESTIANNLETVINIPESNDKKEQIKAQTQTLNPAADFSSIFNVASEEKKEEIPKTTSMPTKQPELAPEVKPATPKKNKPTPQFNKELFNSEEKILYEIKPEKEGNPIAVLFFFIFLATFIIFLPSLVKVAKFNFNPSSNTQEPTEPEESNIYELGSTAVRVAIDNLELNNFVTSRENNEYYLIFTLSNTSAQPYLFDKKYYITLYDDEKIVGYALVHSYDIISAYGASEVKVVLNENTYQRADHFKVEEIVPSRYPNASTIEVDGEYNVLTCNYLNDEMKYYFSNNALIKIKETYKETQSNSTNYTQNKDKYRSISEQYNQIDNFTSTFVETNTDFTMANEIDLKDIPDKTLTDLKVYRYFRYSENINVVAFELEAQGYKCG